MHSLRRAALGVAALPLRRMGLALRRGNASVPRRTHLVREARSGEPDVGPLGQDRHLVRLPLARPQQVVSALNVPPSWSFFIYGEVRELSRLSVSVGAE